MKNQKKKPEDLRGITLKVRATKAECEKPKLAACIRPMDVAKYMHRAALGRKADVDYDTEIVLALMDVTRAIRELCSALVQRDLAPMKEDMQPIVDHAIAAMLRIGTYVENKDVARLIACVNPGSGPCGTHAIRPDAATE